MRLLYVIDSLAPGGAETSLAEMAPGLIARGIDLHVLPLARQLDLAPRLEASGAAVHVHDSPSGRISNVRTVIAVARRTRPSLVHTTLYESDVAGRTAAAILHVPASTSIVNDSYGSSHYAESNRAKLNAARALDALTAVSARRFHALTAAIATSVAPRLWIPRARVEVIPRGRDPRDLPFQPAGVKERIRQELGIPLHSPVIVAIGRLEPQKGLHHLLNALPSLAHDHPGMVVLIAGREGRASLDLRSRAARLRLDIRFLGHRTDVPSLLAAANVLCFPSEREGFGAVLVEALAVGCPVVASTIPTSIEVLQTANEPVGWLYPAADPDQLPEALDSVLSNPVGSIARTRRGREHFEANFTSDAIDERMAQFFQRTATNACVTPSRSG